ncbi:MAG: hypothetical protein EOP49_42100 [Sphingobacteriales bacterium]|nr:MAG: hypothetical protein EOP49_42100 [Sphingobacteriales bacterium]
MTTHSMRPQDIVVLLKIISLNGETWMNKELAAALFLSPAEISNSLHRSTISGLLDADRCRVRLQSLIEFLNYGLPYVFPQMPGGMAKGMPTGHSHDYLKDKIITSETLVWPDAENNHRGFSVQPLYPGAVRAAKSDARLYLYLALTDVLRMGKVREKALALEKLKEEFYEPSY